VLKNQRILSHISELSTDPNLIINFKEAENMLKTKVSKKSLMKFFGALVVLLGYAGLAFADATTAGAGTLGGMADTITTSFTSMGKMMIGVAYLGGFGFCISAIFKFKQHKDNPTQIPLGTPIALLVIGIALVFLPGLIKTGGKTAGLTEAGQFTGEGATTVSGGTK